MSNVFNTTLRFNLDDPEDRRALAYLQDRDRKRYKSYSSAVVAAVNDHFSRQERLAADPFLETRERQEAFLQEVKDTIREAVQTSGAGFGGLAALLQSIQPAPPQEQAMSEEAYDTAMNFINGL
jgi:cation transport regulator ChaC